MNIPKITKRFETSLASALSASGSSFTLESATDEDGNALSGLYGMTIDVGSADVEDFLVTISGTTATVVYRGIDADAPNTEVTANKKAHRRGASVVVTDYPVLAVLRNLLNGDDTIPNKLSYASHPTFSSNQDIPDKQYVDGVAVAGASNADATTKGIVEEATQAEVDARTTTGGTGAKLFAPLDKIRASLYHDYAADAGANDTYAITITPAPTAYTTGMFVAFKAATANTGACTLNVNSLGAKSLKVHGGYDPQDNYIKAGAFVIAIYDSTNFRILSVADKPFVSQSGEEIYAADSVGTDSYAVTLAPAPTAYTTGMVVRFKAGTANTGACTLNVNGLGAKTIKKNYNTDTATGDILQNQIVEAIYDGANFQMISPVATPPITSITFANGIATRAGNTATGSQTIAHGLGVIPKKIRITVTFFWGSANTGCISVGSYNGSVASAVYSMAGSTGSAGEGSGSSYMVMIYQDTTSNSQLATVAMDATNITLSWTKSGTLSANNMNILWEAELNA